MSFNFTTFILFFLENRFILFRYRLNSLQILVSQALHSFNILAHFRISLNSLCILNIRWSSLFRFIVHWIFYIRFMNLQGVWLIDYRNLWGNHIFIQWFKQWRLLLVNHVVSAHCVQGWPHWISTAHVQIWYLRSFWSCESSQVMINIIIFDARIMFLNILYISKRVILIPIRWPLCWWLQLLEVWWYNLLVLTQISIFIDVGPLLNILI